MAAVLYTIFFVLSHYIIQTYAISGTGTASCFGDYPSLLSPYSVVSSGIGSFIQGENWRYTAAVCSTWANKWAGACVSVTCNPGSGNSGGMQCRGSTSFRIIDSLANGCSGNPIHLFDISATPFNEAASDGASCSGFFSLSYQTVSCQSVGLVTGGIKIGIPPSTTDPYCPAFVFSNVAGSGAIDSVSVSTNGGSSWISFRRNSHNGARWDCNGGHGNFLGKSLSFKLTSCTVDSVFGTCVQGDTITLNNVLPSNWCGGGASPCQATSFQASQNFGSGGNPPQIPPPPPPSNPPPSNPPPSNPPPTQGSTVRCGADWPSANSQCGVACTAQNPTCPSGQSCFADLSETPCQNSNPIPPPPPPPPPTTPPPPPPATPPSGSVPSGTNPGTRCGAGWANADQKCGTFCTDDSQCSNGETCFALLNLAPCKNRAISENSGRIYTQATPSENESNNGTTTLYIGIFVGIVVLLVVVALGIFFYRKALSEQTQERV